MTAKYCPRCGRPLPKEGEVCSHCKSLLTFLYFCLAVLIPLMGIVYFKKERSKSRYLYILAYGLHWGMIGLVCFILFKVGLFSLERYQLLGKVPLCNLDQTRAPHFGSFVFILCYRCTFLILGGAFSFLLCCLKKPSVNFFFLLFSIIFILPCLGDGLLQTFTDYLSTNFLRAGTGFLAGVGIGYILYAPFKILSWI